MTLQKAWKELFDDWEELCLDTSGFRKTQQKINADFNERRLAGLPILYPKTPRLAIIDIQLCQDVQYEFMHFGDVLMGVIGTGNAILDITFSNGQQHTLTLNGQPSMILTNNFFPIFSREETIKINYLKESDAYYEWVYGLISEKYREELWSSAIFSDSMKLSLPTFIPRFYQLVPSTKVVKVPDVSEWIHDRAENKKNQQSLFLKELMEKTCHPSRVDNIGIEWEKLLYEEI